MDALWTIIMHELIFLWFGSKSAVGGLLLEYTRAQAGPRWMSIIPCIHEATYTIGRVTAVL